MELPPCFHAVSNSFRELLLLRDSNLGAANFYRFYLSRWGFSEDFYLQSNPDLAAAIPSEVFPDGFSHFRDIGYFEGRLPFRPDVDEQWYLSQYPDVAAAIINGIFQRGADHFWGQGYREGRLARQPQIDSAWYSRVYLGRAPQKPASPQQCLDHFMSMGYLNGALPQPGASFA